MAGLSLDNVFDQENTTRLGKALVRVSNILPRCCITNTGIMRCMFRCILRCTNPTGAARDADSRNKYAAKILGFQQTLYNVPGLQYGIREGYRFPLVLSTYEQILEFNTERRPIQVYPQMTNQIDHVFRRRAGSPICLPERALINWLRMSITHSPAHWYTTRHQSADGSSFLQLDFSTICDEVDHESADCKYNIRDIKLMDDGELAVNDMCPHQCVKKFIVSPDETNRKELVRHAIFLTLTMIQQANEVSYHNWIHFYFNDWVLLEVQTQFPPGHWVRQLLDPHMRYQTVLNNAGMFSSVPNDVKAHEVYDDILFGANLSSWTLDTFKCNIVDKCLGYYLKADFSKACSETSGLHFNLNKLLDDKVRPEGVKLLVLKVNAAILAFVGEVIDASAREGDFETMALVNKNVLKFLHSECLDGISEKDNNVKGIFKLIVSRYILMAGFMHGLEHYEMYFWHAPLMLPQRVRKWLDTSLQLEEYSYDVDKQNGYFGNEMFTRYWQNTDGKWNWASLGYDFSNPDLCTTSFDFVQIIHRLIREYDEEFLKPARKILMEHDIPFPKHCFLTPACIGTSICM